MTLYRVEIPQPLEYYVFEVEAADESEALEIALEQRDNGNFSSLFTVETKFPTEIERIKS